MEELLSKKCTRCGILKTLTNFEKKKDGKYGRRSICKECKKKKIKKYIGVPITTKECHGIILGIISKKN